MYHQQVHQPNHETKQNMHDINQTLQIPSATLPYPSSHCLRLIIIGLAGSHGP
jgi:hypothetical protein